MPSQIVSDTLTNLVVLAGVPLLVYYGVQRRRAGLAGRDILRRAGLQRGDDRVTWICVGVSVVAVVLMTIWPPPVEPFTRPGSAQERFLGMGWSGPTIVAALLYGAVQTGFSEELLFRGLIAGALARRISDAGANILQALIFLVPHLLILFVMPEMWGLLVVVFGAALFAGWARIESGSILGPWILHASVNTTVALSIAVRSGT